MTLKLNAPIFSQVTIELSENEVKVLDEFIAESNDLEKEFNEDWYECIEKMIIKTHWIELMKSMYISWEDIVKFNDSYTII